MSDRSMTLIIGMLNITPPRRLIVPRAIMAGNGNWMQVLQTIQVVFQYKLKRLNIGTHED